MKKLVSICFVAAAAFMISCGGNATTQTAPEAVENVEVVVEDTCCNKTDSTCCGDTTKCAETAAPAAEVKK